jgi:hypothetical protein
MISSTHSGGGGSIFRRYYRYTKPTENRSHLLSTLQISIFLEGRREKLHTQAVAERWFPCTFIDTYTVNNIKSKVALLSIILKRCQCNIKLNHYKHLSGNHRHNSVDSHGKNSYGELQNFTKGLGRSRNTRIRQ